MKDAPGQLVLIEDADPPCRLCGRRLKSARSIRRGMGPGCWRKHRAEEASDETKDKKPRRE